MGGVALAYMASLGIVSFRWFNQAGQPPPPISVAGTSFVFAGLGGLANLDSKFAGTVAWAFVIGAVIAPGVFGNVKPVQGMYGAPPGGWAGLTAEQSQAAIAHQQSGFIGPTLAESQAAADAAKGKG